MATRTLPGLLVVMTMTIVGQVASAQTERSTADGVYTAAQADRGAQSYEMYCKACHEGVDQDGPHLMGSGFMDRWREDRLETLFAQIRNNMPGNRPGGLSEETYLDILSFLLKSNELPPGDAELRADVVSRIQLVGKGGPRPLPNLAPVGVVGCLTAGSNADWSLTQASSPARTKNLTTTTPEELTRSAALPLGAQTFRLQNVNASAAAKKDHKVQAKGVLITQGNSRINVTSLESVAPTCQP